MPIRFYLSRGNILIITLLVLASLTTIWINALANEPVVEKEIKIHAFFDVRLDMLCIVTDTGSISCHPKKELSGKAIEYLNIQIKYEKDVAKNKLKPGIIKIPIPYISP